MLRRRRLLHQRQVPLQVHIAQPRLPRPCPDGRVGRSVVLHLFRAVVEVAELGAPRILHATRFGPQISERRRRRGRGRGGGARATRRAAHEEEGGQEENEKTS
eukprot:6296604-Pyramimonas_sp.AAC.1